MLAIGPSVVLAYSEAVRGRLNRIRSMSASSSMAWRSGMAMPSATSISSARMAAARAPASGRKRNTAPSRSRGVTPVVVEPLHRQRVGRA